MGTDWFLKYGGISFTTSFLLRMLLMLIASIPLLASGIWRNFLLLSWRGSDRKIYINTLNWKWRGTRLFVGEFLLTTYQKYTYKWFAENGILGVKYVVFQWKSLTTGNEELGYWSANFYNLSFNGVQLEYGLVLTPY